MTDIYFNCFNIKEWKVRDVMVEWKNKWNSEAISGKWEYRNGNIYSHFLRIRLLPSISVNIPVSTPIVFS
jgi:hypothetical protein